MMKNARSGSLDGVVAAAVLTVLALALMVYRYWSMASGARETHVALVNDLLLLLGIGWAIALARTRLAWTILTGAIVFAVLGYGASLLITDEVSAQASSTMVRTVVFGELGFAAALFYVTRRSRSQRTREVW